MDHINALMTLYNQKSTKTMLSVLTVKTVFAVIIFLPVIYLLHHQAFNADYIFHQDNLNFYGHVSDLPEHIEFTKLYFANTYYLPHPLWHFFVEYFAGISNFSIEDAAVIFSSFLFMGWVFLIYALAENTPTLSTSSVKREISAALLTFCIIIIGPLCFPPYNQLIYLGQGSPNIWHNITLWMVKPLALLALLSTLKAIAENSAKYYFFGAVATLTSLFAKPNFVIVFLPALFTLLLYRKYFTKPALYFFAITAILSTLILLYQFLNTFNNDSKVVVDFLAVWSSRSQNIPVSIFLALAFPIMFALSQSRKKMNNALLLSWYMTGFGIILFVLFAETGERFRHGNFGWSYMISMSLLYLFSILEFFKEIDTMHTFKRVTLSLLLLSQSVIGLYYFIKIVIGYNPIYITL